MSLALYRGLTTAARPLIHAYLGHRLRTGKEETGRLGERLGEPSLARPPGALVWLHAASVGEAMSMLALITRIHEGWPCITLLVTTGTVTSARIMAQRLPAGVLHQYVPVDRMAWVRRFLDHWRPGLVLWVESEFWPNMLGELRTRAIPAVLVNARISPASFAGWRRWERLIRRLLASFDFCLAQAEADRDKLLALGAGDVRMVGNLKFAAAPLPADQAALQILRTGIGDRPCWLAASTHPGEETVIADAHMKLGGNHPGLLTIIVPRHPTRGPAIAKELAPHDLTTALRSAGALPKDATDIYIADTMGELGLFYRVAPIAFLGGTLIPHGGQNLLEAAKLGCAVIHGPHMTNFQAIVDEMAAKGATASAGNAEEITAAVDALLGDQVLRRARTKAAETVAAEKQGIMDRVLAELAPGLNGLAPPTPAAGQTAAAGDAGA